MSTDKANILSQLAAEIVNNNVCPELALSAKQLVIGDGDPDARIVLIGEAPGKKEDEQGVPFVGAAGKFLDEMLSEVNLNREDIYITNIVKYRPPNNRDPLPEEKAEFTPYLEKQLAIIDPDIVVTLGRHSMEYFLPDMKISAVHGRAFRKHLLPSKADKKIVLMPMYHPAAALYNGGLRQTLIEDFKKVPAVLEKIN